MRPTIDYVKHLVTGKAVVFAGIPAEFDPVFRQWLFAVRALILEIEVDLLRRNQRGSGFHVRDVRTQIHKYNSTWPDGSATSLPHNGYPLSGGAANPDRAQGESGIKGTRDADRLARD